ncbi:class I SAM-dependent methyltransferase [Streptomyces canus]|nr:class I SAM-dependent methyltransferase [Streptomyces canus]
MRGPGVDVAARIAEPGPLRGDGESGAGPESRGEADGPRRGGIGRQRDADRPPQEPNLTTPPDTQAQADSAEQRRKPLTPAATDTRPGTRPPGPGAGAPSHDGTWSADPYAQALRTGQGPLFLRRSDGWLLLLELERWCAAADAADLEVLRRCEGAVLDVGCGPGRLVAALGARGRRVLGIDVSEAAVARTVALGGQALRRSVFESLPGEGRWGTALLIDGNVGIGGDPQALLDRMAQLLAPGGLLIAETVTDPDIDERVQVRVADARGATGNPFPWARLGSPALLRHAPRTDWAPVDQWTAGGRSFVSLRRRTTKTTAEPPNSTAVTSSQRARKPSGDRPVAEA